MTEARGATVVVPTLNRGTYVLDTLRDLLAQTYRPLEILVVDQSSEKDRALLDLAGANTHVISYHHVGFRGLPLARNYGWQHARHEAIVFVDDDIRCGPSLVAEHMRALCQPNVGLIGGGIDERIQPTRRQLRPGHFSFWTATAGRGFEAQGECAVTHVPGGNFSVWRPVLERAGGFDEALATGAALYEETEFCLRARACGYGIRFNGDARLTHLAAGSGGCRVLDVPSYVRALAHNRAFLIHRHLRWFQKITAVARLGILTASYAVRYRDARVFRTSLGGFLEGSRLSRKAPLCTEYRMAASGKAVHA